ncbi:hypothetical protein PAXINDRAFT_172552, partial [Paxillus involutus ATCC 200175]
MSTSFLSVASVNANDRVSLQFLEGQEDWPRCLFFYADENQVMLSRHLDSPPECTPLRGVFIADSASGLVACATFSTNLLLNHPVARIIV